MLGRKLIVIAAAVALAVTQVADASRAHHATTTGKLVVHHRIARRHHHAARDEHHHAENETVAEDGEEEHGEDYDEGGDEETVELCLPGWTEVSVEGVEGIYCAQGQICVADIKDGSCPAPQQGLPYGAYCDTVKTGVYGCKPKSKEQTGESPLCSGEGESPMSVEGVEGVFCVTGQACVADIADGACPGPQEGLPNGAVCGKVKTGVYGCKPAPEKTEEEEPTDDDEDDHEHEEYDDEEDAHDDYDDHETVEVEVDICTGEGESPMSVEGVEGVFCVTGQACVADIKDGACPGPQDGLEYGAYCGTVKTGVYGCKPKSKEQYEHEHVPEEEEAPEDDDSEDSEEEAPAGNPALCTGEGESPMSVEGVEGIFCVTGQACVADIADGACPGPQEGLPSGAVCGKVKTGVYGCKPAPEKEEEEPVDDDDSEDDSDDDYHEENSEDDSDDDYHEETPVGHCGEGESPMSVEGVEGIFCVSGQACVADIADGACPGPQEGLPNGAVCGKVKTGVYGCQPAPEKPEEPVHDGKCGEGESPMSVEGVEGIFCVSGQACVADIKDGACPGPQDGLPNGAECGVVQSGVYGCKPKAAKHHRKSATKKGHSIKVVKAHAHKKVHHKKH